MEELSFRLARLSDFDEIVSLSKGIYEGHDYLPIEFHKWMKMENMAIMLVLFGNRVVGSRAAYIIDDGKTYIRRAGRVLPEFRKQGISQKLSDALDEYVRFSFPTVERMRFVSKYSKFSESLKLKKILQFDVLSYDIEEEEYRESQTWNEESTEIVTCTKDYISNVLFSSHLVEKLFPDNILLYDRVPVEPCSSNFEHIVQEFENLTFCTEKNTANSSPKSFSFGGIAQRVEYIHWTTYIYSRDASLYKEHLMFQFRLACKSIKTRFIFVSSVMGESLSAQGRSLMEDKMHLKVSDNISDRKLNIYELDLVQQNVTEI
ncbi:histidine N-acetyltransferase-like [Stylophora pistillata]|uniref:histidine N-acetyltransferase-like n=1 Tax=Stylophora pistillata TaxID=50429 RepID=UPI000C03FFE5|nr:histidine N-acetyltransferase-like [Stylophora pistillata]